MKEDNSSKLISIQNSEHSKAATLRSQMRKKKTYIWIVHKKNLKNRLQIYLLDLEKTVQKHFNYQQL